MPNGNNILDRTARDKALSVKQQMISKLQSDDVTPEEVREKITQLRRQDVGGRVGAGLERASNLFLQMGGLKGAETKKPSALDELVKLQAIDIKRAGEERAATKEAREQAKFERESLEAQIGQEAEAQKRAELTGGVTPTEAAKTAPAEAAATQAVTPVQTAQGEQFPTTKATVKTGGVTETKEDIGLALGVKKAEAGIASDKEVVTAMRKGRIKSKADLFNADLKIGNTSDSWLDTVDFTFRETGLRPGPVAGVATQVLGRTKQNPYFEGFKGGMVEYAAAVGRIAIPGSRAVRIINLFKGTAPDSFSSIASGIQNASDSYRNAVSSDISNAISNNDKSYDPLIAAAGTKEDYVRNLEQLYKITMAARVLRKNPDLFPEEEQVEVLGGVLREDDQTGEIFLVDPRDNSIIRNVSEGVQ